MCEKERKEKEKPEKSSMTAIRNREIDYISLCSVCGKLRKKTSNRKRRREKNDKEGGAQSHKWWQKTERERGVVYVPEAAAIHRRGPCQNKPNPNNLQLAVNHPEQESTYTLHFNSITTSVPCLEYDFGK